MRERLGARPLALVMAALAGASTAAAAPPSPGHTYAEGALAQAVFRALQPLPAWRWPAGPEEGAAVRIGLRRPGAAWAAAYEPLALARLRDGTPPRWVRVRREGSPATAPLTTIRDFDPVAAGPSRAQDAVHTVAYRLAEAAVVPEPVVVRRCRAAPKLCAALAKEPAEGYVWGIFVRKNLRPGPGSGARRRLADLAADPFGDQLLRRLGADWFVEGGAAVGGAVPHAGGLVP